MLNVNELECIMTGTSNDTYIFRSKIITGITMSEKGNVFDYYVDRPLGMKGYVMHMTTKGKGRIINGGEDLVSEEGDIYLFPPGIPHHYGRLSEFGVWGHHWVYFHPRAYWSDLLRWDKLSNGLMRYRPEEDKVEIFKNLFDELVRVGKINTQLMQLMSYNVLEYILLKKNEFSDSLLTVNIDERISFVCRFINENLFKKELSITSLANLVSLSNSRLIHLFKQQLGVTIVQWRDEQRIIMAQKLLLETQLPISEISARVGYDDPLYFSKVFKKHAGSSPRNYRNEPVSQ